MDKLTLRDLEQIEELAHKSGTSEAQTVLRLSAALRNALQEKENAVAMVGVFKRRAGTTERRDTASHPVRKVTHLSAG
jgi:hypothetical protein